MATVLRRTLYVLIVFLSSFMSNFAPAAINVDRTRIVMSSSDKSLAITLTNESKDVPFLAQSWIEEANGKRSETYLLALPPLQRIDGGKKAQVRIMALPGMESLPKDRETLFYYNIREVPPKSDKANVLQIAMQSRLKLFWRPESIKKATNVRTEEQLTIERNAKEIIIKNPTPYYITLAYLGVDNKGSFSGFDSIMLAPFSSQTFNSGYFNGNELNVGYIDDFGGLKINIYHCAGTLCSIKTQR